MLRIKTVLPTPIYTIRVCNTDDKIMFIRIVVLMRIQYIAVIAAAALIAAGGLLFYFTQNNENTPVEGYLYAPTRRRI